jgi:BirA family transcriptional regulator, biotin operon repressor / biotin---[acetyl-CoA-carboxylase] ligase
VTSGRLELPQGFSVLAFDEIGSTSDEAQRQAVLGAPAGTLIWAKRQVGGRGRRGRPWVSPEGNCDSSLILRPKVTPAEAAQISFVTAIAVAEAVAVQLPVGRRVSCKWPNDVLIDGAKCCGILLESRSGTAGLDWLIVGVGINIESFPAGMEYPATCLKAAGAAVTVETMLEGYIAHMATRLARWEREGFMPIREAWLRWADGLGEPVRVRLGDATLDGVFESLDEEGALMLATKDGSRRRITAGDVFRAD